MSKTFHGAKFKEVEKVWTFPVEQSEFELEKNQMSIDTKDKHILG